MGSIPLQGYPPAFYQASLEIGWYLFLVLKRERHSVVINILHNTLTQPGLESGPLDLESCALNNRPLLLIQLLTVYLT